MDALRIYSFCLLVIIVSPLAAAADERPTPDEYWRKIRAVVADRYEGLDLNPVLTTGYQFSGDNEGPMVGVQIDLPLWNKKRKQERREEAVKFLQKGAELVRELETCIETLKLLREKCRFLKAIMREEGVDSVDAFFDAQQEILEYQALETQYHRELQGLIDPASRKVKIKSKPEPAAEQAAYQRKG